jgi:hypothetical protein
VDKISRRSAMRAATASAVAIGTTAFGGTAVGDEPKAAKLWTLEGASLDLVPHYGWIDRERSRAFDGTFR